MTPIEFEEQTFIVAKDQPQYMPLPAHMDASNSEFRLTCCWQLTFRERLTLLFTGRIWHQVLTFGSNLQPQLLLTQKPAMKSPIEQFRTMQVNK